LTKMQELLTKRLYIFVKTKEMEKNKPNTHDRRRADAGQLVSTTKPLFLERMEKQPIQITPTILIDSLKYGVANYYSLSR